MADKSYGKRLQEWIESQAPSIERASLTPLYRRFTAAAQTLGEDPITREGLRLWRAEGIKAELDTRSLRLLAAVREESPAETDDWLKGKTPKKTPPQVDETTGAYLLDLPTQVSIAPLWQVYEILEVCLQRLREAPMANWLQLQALLLAEKQRQGISDDRAFAEYLSLDYEVVSSLLRGLAIVPTEEIANQLGTLISDGIDYNNYPLFDQLLGFDRGSNENGAAHLDSPTHISDIHCLPNGSNGHTA